MYLLCSPSHHTCGKIKMRETKSTIHSRLRMTCGRCLMLAFVSFHSRTALCCLAAANTLRLICVSCAYFLFVALPRIFCLSVVVRRRRRRRRHCCFCFCCATADGCEFWRWRHRFAFDWSQNIFPVPQALAWMCAVCLRCLVLHVLHAVMANASTHAKRKTLMKRIRRRK